MTVQDVERVLLAHGIADKPSDTLMKSLKSSRGDDSESEEDDEDAEFGTMRMGKKGEMRGLKQGGVGLGLGGMGKGRRKADDSDSDFDM